MKDYYTPAWLPFPFIIGICLAVLLLAFFIKKHAPQAQKNTLFVKVIVFLVLYFSYVFVAGYFGLFMAVSLPPRILLLTTLPYALFLFLYIIKLDTTQKIIANASLSGLISLHIFRILGFTFVILALHDALPKAFAYIAGFGDLITALSSVGVVWAINNKRPYAKKLATYWNIFGFVDILFTAIMANVLTKISMDSGAMGVDSLAKFPYSLIPAFAPPTIIFLHVLIFKKIKLFST